MEANANIVVIDDNPGDIELLRMALESAGVDCTLNVLDNGRDAMEFVQRLGRFSGVSAPDLVVLDLNLPGNDGVEILQALRNGGAFPDVAVVVLSSSSSPREQLRVASLRVKRFIIKPPDLDAFMKIGVTLGELLAQKRGDEAAAGG